MKTKLGFSRVFVLFMFNFKVIKKSTSRERPKSAPYLRLKNSKRTSKCQNNGELGTLLWKKIEKVSQSRKTERGYPLGIFNIHSVGRYQKIEGGHFGESFFFQKKTSHIAENTLREYPLTPLSFLDDVKILLRKLSKNCKNCKIVKNVRKVDHSE